LYSSPSVIGVIESRTMRWAGQVAQLVRSAYMYRLSRKIWKKRGH
jgi:hypothetical protein